MALVSSGIVIVLSAVGIPASFVVIATACIVGLGWGRATRRVSVAGAGSPSLSDLFDLRATVRVVLMQNLVPILATGGSFRTFQILARPGIV